MPPKRRDDNTTRSSKRLKSTNPETVLSTAAQRKLSNKDYTISLICAITTKYVAAQAFLNATHDLLETVPPNNNNIYKLGEIGKHNVVIAVLLKGRYSTTSATSVVKDMLCTFPYIRFSLIVGISGGALSSKHDIRLGDIVVSTPYNKKGGLF
jgi:nucleoside phosphorylase